MTRVTPVVHVRPSLAELKLICAAGAAPCDKPVSRRPAVSGRMVRPASYAAPAAVAVIASALAGPAPALAAADALARADEQRRLVHPKADALAFEDTPAWNAYVRPTRLTPHEIALGKQRPRKKLAA